MKIKLTLLLVSIIVNCFAQFTKVFDEAVIDNVFFGDNAILTPLNGFTLLDTLGDVIWSKQLVDLDNNKVVESFTTNMDMNENGDFLILTKVYENSINKFGIAFLNNSGEVVWTKIFQPDPSASQLLRDYTLHAFFTENRIYLLGDYFIEDLNRKVISIIELDMNGNLISNSSYDDQDLGNQNFVGETSFYTLNDEVFIYVYSFFNEDKSFIAVFNVETGSIDTYEMGIFVSNISISNFDNSIYIIGDSGSLRGPKVFKLTPDLEQIMGKFLKLESYINGRNKVAFTDKGVLFKTGESFNSSDVFSLIDYNGSLVGAWRLPQGSGFEFPMFGSDRHVFYFSFASSFADMQPSFFVACHDPEFNNFGCYVPETCIEIEDVEINISKVNNIFVPLSLDLSIENKNYVTEDVIADSRDFCPDDFNPLAVPLFSSDDTLCIGEAVPLYNLQNINAESVQWSMPGASIEFSELNDPIFTYNNAGRYTITQTVEFAGCFSDFSVDVVVVEPGEVVLDTVKYLCQDEPLVLDAIQSFDASYLWMTDSSTLSLLEVVEANIYPLKITERHCMQRFDIEVQDFDYSRILVPLPSDSAICMQRPIRIELDIDMQTEFTWSDEFPNLQRQINESGFYTLTTSLEGCATTSSILVNAEDCSTQLYIPNAFSPNLDGINDDFYPLGDFFEVLSFRVYDRWGNLVHDEASTPWDGTFRNKTAPTGVYCFVLQIENTLLQEVEILKGDVVLVR